VEKTWRILGDGDGQLVGDSDGQLVGDGYGQLVEKDRISVGGLRQLVEKTWRILGDGDGQLVGDSDGQLVGFASWWRMTWNFRRCFASW
jgi:hypothetical protein